MAYEAKVWGPTINGCHVCSRPSRRRPGPKLSPRIFQWAAVAREAAWIPTFVGTNGVGVNPAL